MTFSFPKSARLLKRKEFVNVFKRPEKYLKGAFICVKIKFQETAPRLGIEVSKKFGNACMRNRFKRLVRESFRHLKNDLEPIDVVVFPKPSAKGANFSQMFEELKELLHDYSNNTPS